MIFFFLSLLVWAALLWSLDWNLLETKNLLVTEIKHHTCRNWKNNNNGDIGSLLVFLLYFSSRSDMIILHKCILSSDNIICITEALKNHRPGPQPHCARSCTKRAEELPIHQKECNQHKATVLMQTDVGVQGKWSFV